MSIAYTLVRSNRRTLSLEITDQLTVLVRAPRACPQWEIERFVEKSVPWIGAHTARRRDYLESHPEPTPEEQRLLKQRAKEELPARTEYYARIMGLTPSHIAITGAKKRFGSCSASNRICYSWRLMRYPQAAVDYVVVHELAHIVHKNHGRAFYALVAKILPDYKQRRALLKG